MPTALMSLAGSPDCLFRPEDKAFKMLYPSVEEPMDNSFDEFFASDSYYPQTDSQSERSAEDYHNIQSIEQNIDPAIRGVGIEGDAPGPWRKGLWCLNDNTPGLVIGKTRRNSQFSRAFVSPTHLISNQNIATKSPTRSIAATTVETKNPSSLPKAVMYSRNRHVRVPVTREQTLSPSPMHAQLPTHEDMTHRNDWQQDFQNFHLQVPDEKQVVSPTLVDHTFPRLHADVKQANTISVAQNATVAYPPRSPTRYHYPFQHVAHTEAGGASDRNAKAVNPNFVAVSTSQIASDQLVAMPGPYHTYMGIEQEGTQWATESLHSSDSSYQSQHSYYSHDVPQQSYPPVPQQVWVSPEHHQLYIDTSGHSQDFHDHVVAPTPQRGPHYVIYQQQESSYDALSAQYPAAHEIGRAVEYTPNIFPQPQARNTTPFQSIPPLPNPFLTTYPPLPPAPADDFSEVSPFTTPRRQFRSKSRSTSPQISPNQVSPARNLRHRSPSRSENTHNRRKSINKAGPIKDGGSSNRARSSSRPARTPKTPRTPTGGFQVDFVNFTPKDAHKLMADVAPSGSSKTRARRDQEARDKRKKLADAALREVQRAGGDVLALKEAGILV